MPASDREGKGKGRKGDDAKGGGRKGNKGDRKGKGGSESEASGKDREHSKKIFDIYCKVLARKIKHHETGQLVKPCMFFQIGKSCTWENCQRSHDASFQCTKQERQACEEQVKINAAKRERLAQGETSQSGNEDQRKKKSGK